MTLNTAIGSTEEPYFDVVLTGEIDVANCADIRGQLVRALDSCEGGRAHVDLRYVTFIDSSGLSAFIAAHKYAVSSAREIVFVAPQPPVKNVFEISGLVDVLYIVG